VSNNYYLLILRLDEYQQSVWLLAGRPGLDSRVGQGFVSSPPPPDWIWDPPILLTNGYIELKLPERETDTHFRAVLSLRIRGVFPLSASRSLRLVFSHENIVCISFFTSYAIPSLTSP
jgi:hypothetical protein